jgi:predicted PurR-regulated permease PerM
MSAKVVTPEIPVRGEAVEESTRTLRSAFLIALAFVAVLGSLWLLYRIQIVLMILALSVLFAHLVAPLVALFRKPVPFFGERRAPHSLAIVAAYLAIALAFTAVAALVWPTVDTQLTELRSDAPANLARVQADWHTWRQGQTRMFPRSFRATVDGVVDQALTAGGSFVHDDLLPRVGGWLMHLPWLILVPIFAYFLLRDAELFRKSALHLFERRRVRWRFDVFFGDVSRTLTAYIRAQALGCLDVAILCTLGFLVLGVPYPILFGVIAGLLELLPLVGPLIVATLVVGLVAVQSFSHALLAAGFLLAVRIVQDYVIYPKLVGRELPLHPLAVILAILCGGEVAGIAGVFLSVPVVAILTVGLHHWRAHRAAEAPRPAIA